MEVGGKLLTFSKSPASTECKEPRSGWMSPEASHISESPAAALPTGAVLLCLRGSCRLKARGKNQFRYRPSSREAPSVNSTSKHKK